MTEDLKAECNELKGIVHKLREEVSHCEYNGHTLWITSFMYLYVENCVAANLRNVFDA